MERRSGRTGDLPHPGTSVPSGGEPFHSLWEMKRSATETPSRTQKKHDSHIMLLPVSSRWKGILRVRGNGVMSASCERGEPVHQSHREGAQTHWPLLMQLNLKHPEDSANHTLVHSLPKLDLPCSESRMPMGTNPTPLYVYHLHSVKRKNLLEAFVRNAPI